MTEPAERGTPDSLENRLRRVCRDLELMAYHTHDSRRSVEGYPDWTIATPAAVVFIEQKAAGGRLTYDQAAWLWALSGSGRLAIAAEGLEGLEVCERLLRRLATGAGLPSKVSASVGPWGTSTRMRDQLGERPDRI